MAYNSFFINIRVDTGPISLIEVPNNISYDDFLEKVSTSTADLLDMSNVALYNNKNSKIVEADFIQIIHQFKNCGEFIVNVVTKSAAHEDDTGGRNILVTSDVVREYILFNSGANILSEYSKTKNLTEASRKSLVRILTRFLMHHFTDKPRANDKVAVSKAAIQLFPIFRIKNSSVGGIDLFYCPSTHTGWIENNLKYMRSKQCALNQAPEDMANLSIEEDGTAVDLEFFKTCFYDKTNKQQCDLIRDNLKKSIKERVALMENSNIDIRVGFPCMLLNHDLVIYDFEIRKISSSANGFRDFWLKHRTLIPTLFDDNGQHIMTGFDTNRDIKPMLLMLKKLTPQNVMATNMIPVIAKFIRAVKRNELINLDDNKEGLNTYSSIFASCDANKTDKIIQFFVNIQDNIITFPKNYLFIDVLDYYFKMHHVFRLKQHPQLRMFMKFFDIYGYKMNVRVGGPTYTKLFDDLSSAASNNNNSN